MPEYEFTLKFKLPNFNTNPEIYIDKLYESGCDDALIGVGTKGYIALNFIRESDSAYEAIKSAMENVKSVIPGVELVEALPDWVGVTDIANLLGCTRQNIQKLILKDNSSCPSAIHSGAQSIWHLAEFLTWLSEDKNYEIEESLLETAKITMNLNLAKEYKKLAPDLHESFKSLVTST
ncbi:prophage CP4-57 regulatory (plasmid) [Gloeothece citriformis PCC 7424]|uniref:Prophage CP4-57 regulatory n=1 Tax=Gloeothece citriformis (strain PCC 7424) TaxID=65393 RepID=B7KLT2_GLOC7|nr:hypothetical protein [Gloeothece citriformis]ACK73754.1 prophage CP4-57 regulatory [Gloeothece citriformis PCC 7424]